MPLYNATIVGRRKPLLILAPNATKANDMLVSLKALTSAERDQALVDGLKVWSPGDPVPADDPEPEAVEESGEEVEREPAGDELGQLANEEIEVIPPVPEREPTPEPEQMTRRTKSA